MLRRGSLLLTTNVSKAETSYQQLDKQKVIPTLKFVDGLLLILWLLYCYTYSIRNGFCH